MKVVTYQRGVISLLVVFVLLAGIVAGLFLVQRTQIFKPRATNDQTRVEFINSSGEIISQTTSRDIRVKITYVFPSPSPSPTPSPEPSPTNSPSPSPDPSSSPSPSLTPSPSPSASPETFPTYFRISNNLNTLSDSGDRLFDSNPIIIDWILIDNPETKTVYVQFKINSSWITPISSSIALVVPSPSPIASSSPSPSPSPSPSNSPSPSPRPSLSPTPSPTPIQTPAPIQPVSTPNPTPIALNLPQPNLQQDVIRRVPPSEEPKPTPTTEPAVIKATKDIPILGGVVNYVITSVNNIISFWKGI